uniref:Uncharacterized protein n=1 Tax=Panagrolaimus sp. JU765 TaxID=591449 RepID=A0AC34Q3H0_9BILA
MASPAAKAPHHSASILLEISDAMASRRQKAAEECLSQFAVKTDAAFFLDNKLRTIRNILEKVGQLPQIDAELGHQSFKSSKKGKVKPATEVERRVADAFAKKAGADGTEELLYKSLLDPNYYEKDVRPTPHHSLPTNVTFGFLLNQIVEMDERNQVLTTRCWLNVNNAVREYSASILSTDLMVTEVGNVTWLFSGLFTSSCQMRVRYYPFDSQECELKFASWSHDISEIDLVLTTNEGDLSSYMNSTEFDLTEMWATRQIHHFPTDNHSLWPTVAIQIKMERRPLFYVFNHILPCMLISAMAVFAFSMPPETGEKINMSITTMLSMGVYLQSITESIPPTSDAVPIIGQYYVASLFIVCLATAMNVMSLNVHREGIISQGRHVPWWMERFILGYLARILGMTIHEPDSITLLKTSQAKQSTIRRSSLLRDLKRLRTADSTKRTEKTRQTCECILANSQNYGFVRKTSKCPFTDAELAEMPKAMPGESAFLQRMVHDQVLPRMTATKPAMLGEFEERFKRILKRIYRSLQQREIRDEVVDERKKLQWEWLMLASVVDRFLLVVFSFATFMTIVVFLILPVNLRASSFEIF